MKESQSISLKQLLGDYVAINCLPDIPVTGMNLDSRKIQSGNIFVALAGQNEHGLAFAEMAISNGAVAVLCDRKFDQYCQQMLSTLMTRTICIPVDNLKTRLGEIASQFYDEPSKKLFTVGVTGTDGKTSVSHFIAQAFDFLDQSAAVIGTIGNGLINNLKAATHTTPDVIQVHKILSELVDKGAAQVAMEVSSHGLDQGRVNGVDFDVAVLTNLGRDHLDYHGDIESYGEAKKKLFQQKNIKTAVLNMDDEFGRQLVHDLNGKVDIWGYATQTEESCGIKNIVSASGIKMHDQGLSMHINSPRGEADVNLNLMGRFNVANVLATLAVLLIKNIEFTHAIQSIERLVTVAGRMQVIKEDNKPAIVIDYAHTPQALESALKSLKDHSRKKLICIFGCGGDRDKGKRPLMAKVAENYADEIFVTDDNPRTENAENITDDIFTGFNDVSKIQLIHDRKQAISQAIKQASNEDIILLAGKGHENYQIAGDIKHPFSDALVVKACLEETE